MEKVLANMKHLAMTKMMKQFVRNERLQVGNGRFDEKISENESGVQIRIRNCDG